MRSFLIIAALITAAPALAQGSSFTQDPAVTGTITVQPNDTGGGEDETISFGATGADTINSNSAAGGNASRPERAVPNGSANGGNNNGG